MAVDTWTLIKCALPPLLGGAAYLLLQYLIHPSPRQATDPTADASPVPTGILWLGPASQAALGSCASPCRLRSVTVECIARRLRAHCDSFGVDEPMPSRAQFSTWPHQASLIADGDLAGLRAWQNAALGTSAEGSVPGPAVEPARVSPLMFALWQLPWLLALTAAWVAYCSYRPPPCPDPIVTITEELRLNLSLAADQLFEFNDSTLSPVRQDYLAARFERLLREFVSLDIRSVDAFTDPLGTRAFNDDLSRRRRETIINFLRARKIDRLTVGNLPVSQESPLGPPRADLDVRLFESCMDTPGAQQRFKVSTNPELGYPPLFPEVRQAQGLNHDRTYSRIVSCLSPLRRVDIALTATFLHRAKSPTPQSAPTTGDQR